MAPAPIAAYSSCMPRTPRKYPRRLPVIWSPAVAALLAAPAAWGQPVWDISDHGARPGRDAAAVINEGLRTQHEHGLPVYVPHGRWLVTETIKMPRREGAALIGAGMGSEANRALAGLGSMLQWRGPAGLPMIEITGVRQRLGDLTLRGAPVGRGEPRGAIGLLVTKRGRGLGTGKSDFQRLRIAHFDVGVQCGRDPAEHNNDLLSYRRLILDGCGVGYRVVNSQSMSHLFDVLEVRRTPVTFEFLGGGMLHARNVFTLGTTLLSLRRNEPPKYSPGPNNHLFRIENLKVDAQHKGRFQLLKSDAKSSGVVVLDGGLVSGSAPFKLAQLGAGVRLVVRDFSSPSEQVSLDRHPRGEVLLDNAHARGLAATNQPAATGAGQAGAPHNMPR